MPGEPTEEMPPGAAGDQHYGDAEGGDDGPARAWPRGSAEFDRIIFLSDGVFAIVMTILVLDLHVPVVADPQHQLTDAVRAEWSSFFAFGLTFALLAVSWMGHHRFVSGLVRVDTRFVRWNFLYLALICLMPYASSLIAEYADDSSFAVACYLGLLGLLGLVDLLGDALAVRRGYLPTPGYPTWIRYSLIDTTARTAVMAIGIVIAYVSPRPSDGLLWLLALVPLSMFTSRYRPERR
jgi:uncharacterized membrane protein